MPIPEIIDQIAEVARRLNVLSDKHRIAMNAINTANAEDLQLVNDLQAEAGQLIEIKRRLLASIASPPPGTTGRPVR
jgi:hypothetical protein